MTRSSRKSSFFRKLSLSSPPKEAPPLRLAQNGDNEHDLSRSFQPLPLQQAATSRGVLPPGAAPGAYTDSNKDHRSDNVVLHGPPRISSTNVSRSSPARTATNPKITPPHSPSSRQRQPIYPALASPPNSPPTKAYTIDLARPRAVDRVSSQSKGTNLESGIATETAALGRYADAGGDVVAFSSTHDGVAPRRTISSRPAVKPAHSTGRIPSFTLHPSSQSKPMGAPVSEARAYASAMTYTMSRDGPSRQDAASAPPLVPVQRRGSRPLPQPPSHPRSLALPQSASSSSIHVIASNDGTGRRNASPLRSPKTRPKMLVAPHDTVPKFDFPRSPTLPPLVDPRTAPQMAPIDQWSATQSLFSSQVPSLQTSNSEVVPRQNITLSSSADRPPRTLSALLTHPQIQASVLSGLTINSFLSLTGSSESIRRCFTGELVGRWIMREWGVQVDRERGRSWPNLTVWEGFLESLLHDPATYSTYPAQWHNLLRHLSLSHTLIVLHLRSLPPTAFPNLAPMPFEEETLPHSHSTASFPRSRVGSDTGSIMPSKAPKQERLLEIIMPEPLASKPGIESSVIPVDRKMTRRSSVNSLASVASFSFGRRRSNSVASASIPMADVAAMPMASGKADLPPVSYPSAKRYGFKRHGDPPSSLRSRTFSENSRPGSIRSVQSSNHSVALSHWISANRQPQFAPPPIPSNRASFASVRSTQSPIQRFGSPHRKDGPSAKVEPAFDKPPPFVQGRVPILRVFVPVSDRVPRWPSAEGAAAAMAELDKCGASRRLQIGDLIVNTAVRQPKTTEHVLIYIPSVRHMLLPLDYRHCLTGHLPSYVDGFSLSPSYYHPFLANPQIVYLDLRAFAQQGIASLRLAFDRRDMTIASGAKLTAKRYLYVAGFEIKGDGPHAPEWHGTVSLEAEGTAEAKAAMIERFTAGKRYPWEIVREKSMSGLVWLKLVKE